MASADAKVGYIHYAFPTTSENDATTLQEIRNSTAANSTHDSPPPAKAEAQGSDKLESNRDTSPDYNGFARSATTEIKSNRILEWINHNTGEPGSDGERGVIGGEEGGGGGGGGGGDGRRGVNPWRPAGSFNAKSRKRNGRATTNKESLPLSSATRAPGQHPPREDYEDDPVELNSTIPERFGKSKHQREPMMANLGPQSQQSIPTNHAIREYMQQARLSAATGFWQALQEIPCSVEVMQEPDDNIIPRNKIDGAWKSTEEYLEAHYRLIREDAVFPLRSAIHQVREHPNAKEEFFNGSIGIYDKVQIVGLTCDIRAIALRLSFSLGRIGKRVKWEQSKRLISGTLIALTPTTDMFQNKCIIAVVAARAIAGVQLNPPEIDIYVPRAAEMEIDPFTEWIMVEERASYFEASRHVLTALQKLSHEPFPLQEHLVSVETKVNMPSYISTHPVLDMSTAFEATEDQSYKNVDIVNGWPKKPSTTLDSSQLTALRRILAKKLAIIQGPPGTGKTHVSVEALKVMLANMQPEDPPIIVSCQTNHALDQLLRHVAQFEKKFIRLGGRSKDREVVKERTLYEVRRNTKQHPGVGSLKASARIKMREVTANIYDLLKPLAPGSDRVLDPQIFKDLGLLSDKQCQSLKDGDQEWTQCDLDGTSADQPMQQWLRGNLQIVTKQVHPDDCIYDYEQADLESEAVQEIEAEAKMMDDDFVEGLRGDFFPIRDTYTGKTLSNLTDEEIEAVLRDTQDLYKIPLKRRGSVFSYLQRQLKQQFLAAIRDETQKYNELAIQRRIGAWESDLAILRTQKLIGVTTTGFSKYRALISALNPRTILVEEAAESIEAPIAVACVPSVEQLILVGDHQQLRPQCSVKYFEGAPFNLNVSLFERLILNDVEYEVIRRQRRMIPEVRRLLEPIYGVGVIKDHEMVKNVGHRPPVPGMGGVNSYFFTHEWPETRDENSSSCNVQEADMLVAFFDYLVLNGIPPQNITVMTFYNGQRKTLIKAFRKNPNLRGNVYNVVTVDSYQGEQNDVILLSLTRSNDNYSIGFLSVVNRICVALSRAKRGFYLFGNAEILCSESKMWEDVIRIMMGKTGEICPDPRKRIGFYVPLKCENHGRTVLVESIDDFQAINGGCTLPCNGTLPCGHACELRCHTFAHDQVVCNKPCQRMAQCGHPCKAECCEACRCSLCKEEEQLDPVISMSPSLRALNASGPVIPVSYSLAGTTAVQEHPRREGQPRSPSAWRNYADTGVKAHDIQLVADPHRTFHEWDSSTFKHSAVTSTVSNVTNAANQLQIAGMKGNSEDRLALQRPAMVEQPQDLAGMELIDFD